MALRINLEIGHEASLRTKRTPEGYTHDWKVFVRGCDGADIHYYVEKVVFHLHETFQKPKRVVKEPPYAVKESGYAGFNLPIDIYLRNSGEPKKIKFNYDLDLQPSGPPLSRVQKEKYLFSSLPDEFKQKVIRGGGIMTNNSQESNESKSVLYEEKNQLISKPKFSGSEQPSKKPKTEPHISNSFQDLFGPPITKTTKVTAAKAQPPKENKNVSKPEKDKGVEKLKSNKHSPHKDKDKERDKSEKKAKEEKKKDKEKKDKERERSKEKSFKKEKSPKVSSSPSPRHQSPSPPSVPFEQAATKHRDKEPKGDKEKKEKPDKEEKKAKKEKKEKDHNRDKEKHRESKNEHKDRKSKTKEMFPPPKQPTFQQQQQQQPQQQLTPSVSSALQSQMKPEKKEVPKDEERTKPERLEKSEDKKHKHKKKDKNKKERDDLDEKTHKPAKKTEKEKNSAATNSLNEAATEKNLFGSSPKTKAGPVAPSPKDKNKTNKLLTYVDEPSDSSASSREPSPVPDQKKRDKKNRDDKQNVEKDSDKKKKRKASPEQEPPGKSVKEEDVKNSISDIEMSNAIDSDMPEKNNPGNEDEYMNILRSLQHKIMALKENSDLQKVVELIAETGQYEISAHTFDFDLCLLNPATVRQLQDFLSTIS